MNAADRLIEAIEETRNPTALGLDTQLAHLPDEYEGMRLTGNREICAGIFRYNEALLRLMRGVIPRVKLQVAYYEQLGIAGMDVFSKTLHAAKDMGYVTIADVKRGDIGATSEAYARAYLKPGADFEADYITVNGYLGDDGIFPFLKLCQEYEKGIFVLVKTSNLSSGQLQDQFMGKTRMYEVMGDLVAHWGEGLIGERGYSSVGAVVGATYPEQGKALRDRLPRTFFLVPGYGVQGATGADLRGCFDESGHGALVNASRSLLAAYQKVDGLPWRDAVMAEALRMRKDITETAANRLRSL